MWDLFVRLFHWTLAATFAVAYFVTDSNLVHVGAGAVIGALIAARVVWGFVGPARARFADFLYPPTTVFHYVRDLLRFRKHAHYVGHSPGGGYVILAMLGLLAATAFTGVTGPADWHGILADASLTVVLIHVGGVLLRSYVYGQDLVRAQFTGYKRL